jgi:hypothetical protein
MPFGGIAAEFAMAACVDGVCAELELCGDQDTELEVACWRLRKAACKGVGYGGGEARQGGEGSHGGLGVFKMLLL